MSIWDRRPEFEERLPEWELVRDELAGTPAMRGASPGATPTHFASQQGQFTGSTPWLPRLATDSDSSYRTRWERAYFFGAFPDAVRRIANKPFTEPVTVRNVPPEHFIETVVRRDADARGTSLHRFAQGHFETKIAFGTSHVLLARAGIDSIPERYRLGDSISEAGRRRFRMTPYMRRIHPMRIPAWEFGRDGDGSPRLIEARVRDDRYERDGDKYVLIERLHVYRIDDSGEAFLETHRRPASDGGSGVGKLETSERIQLGIPWIPIYTDPAKETESPDEAMTCRPLLADLLWSNLQHFQESAEQGVALLFARAEAPVEIGCTEDESKQALPFGLGRAMRKANTSPEEYSLQFVGPSGVGVEHGRESLKELEARMAKLGAQPLIRQTANVTARGAVVDEAKTEAEAERLARASEDFFERIGLDMHRWEHGLESRADAKLALPDLEIDIFADFGFDLGDTVERARLILELHKSGLYPDRLVIESWRGLKLLPEEIDVDEVMAQVEEQRARDLDRAIAAMEKRRGGESEPDEEDGRNGAPPSAQRAS